METQRHLRHRRSPIREQRTRVNSAIRISPVRLIGEDGTQLGVVSLDEARAVAHEAGLDLVEVAATARPPVCRVMDYGKHQYEEQKRAREARKKQHTVDVKEIKLRPATDTHDLETKIRHARRFLEKGSKVKFTMRFRGREAAHSDLAKRVFDDLAETLVELGKVEARDHRVEGRLMSMVLAPQRVPARVA